MRQHTFFDVPAAMPAPVPYTAGSNTSKASAEEIRPHVAEIRQAVYAFVVSCGELGATDEELYAALGPDRRDSLRPRRCELRNSGHIVDSGRRRPTHTGRSAAVWIWTGKPFEGKGE
jgi:hypothetical protein